MKKFFLLLAVLFSTNVLLFSQTLFLYGDKKVSKQSFLTAFSKNPPKQPERRKALDEYLGLYINYRLKVQAGYDDGLDKVPSFIQESKNFRKQIAENVINEEVGIKRLTQEAVLRSQKDIHVAQVFVEINAQTDSVKALQQINAAYAALQAGKSFESVTQKFSNDSAIIKSKGDLGFITVFTLSYPIENEIYALKPGGYSKPYRSSFGYHIFKDIAERPAFGKRKIAQILIATPPKCTDEQKKKYANLADSVYNLIQKGEKFERMASQFSNDYKTSNIGGVAGEIAVGQYDTSYEKKIFAIQNVGDVTKPIATAYGYHIIKLLEKKPVVKDVNDAANFAAMKQVVEKDERLTLNKKKLLSKWMAITKYKPSIYDTVAFKQYTDSNLNNKITNGIKNISDTTVLFSFEKKKIYASDWAVYVTKNFPKATGDYSRPFKKFVEQTCTQYYTDNLELYSEAMQEQGKEFDEANILFAAMDKHVWAKAGEDVSGLKDYFATHKEKYQWKASVDALVFSCKNKEVSIELSTKIKKAPQDWRSLTNNFGQDANADSGRYEIKQLPVKQQIESKAGFISTPEKSANDDTYTFIYIINTHPQLEPRTYDEAKGMVINDYQQLLEQEWIASLKKKYPITVNQAVWKTIQ